MAMPATNLTPNEYYTILRHDFYSLMERSFYELNPDAKFFPNWHIELVCSELEACWRGETKRLIICVPPRSLKSHCASIAFPAWLLGQNPSAQIISASYGQELANKLALDCRTLMNSALYRKSFPTRLSNQKQAVSEFMTDAHGFRLATSVWNQKLQLHPHVHCVVPAGGLSRDHARWIRSHPRFFLPIPVLRRVFRGKFVAGLKSAFDRRQLHLAGDCTAHPSQVLRRLAASALPQRLDRLFQTTLRRTRVRTAVSRPLYHTALLSPTIA